jgi:hypothetical protein
MQKRVKSEFIDAKSEQKASSLMQKRAKSEFIDAKASKKRVN